MTHAWFVGNFVGFAKPKKLKTVLKGLEAPKPKKIMTAAEMIIARRGSLGPRTGRKPTSSQGDDHGG